MSTLNNNKWFKWINIYLIGILFLLKTTLEILKNSNSSITSNSYLNDIDNNWIWIGISIYIVIIPAFKYFSYYKQLLKGRFHMDLLIAIATHISFIFSVVVVSIDANMKMIVEPIGLLFVFNEISKWIESKITLKNDSERTSLESLKLKEVMMSDHNTKKVGDVKVGDVVMFHKNEIIQFDGVVFMGEAIIDTSNINGESKPYYAKKSSSITAGTKLKSDMLMLKVTKSFNDSTLNQLIETISNTSSATPKMQTFANKLYKIFIPSVLLITLITFIIWISITSITGTYPSTVNSTNNIYSSFFVTISVLAIACPCAMTMAAPIVSYVTAQFYWKNNIIFNKTEHIEIINEITNVVVDKTGTITSGEMEIIQSFGSEKYHSIASALEESVYHPIATAIFKKYDNGIKLTDIKEIPSKGVLGTYNGKMYKIKSTNIAEINKIFKTEIKRGTFVGLYESDKLVSAYVLRSEIKKDAEKLITYLKSKNINITMLSGDNEEETARVANILKIDYKSNQKPEDKAEYINKLQKEEKVVMMIGDGLNDSIAVKAADISISFAHGSNITNSYSSVSFLDDGLDTLIFLFMMAKRAKRYYSLALIWAISFNILLLPVAMLGFIYPWASASVMYISNLILYTVIGFYWMNLAKLEKNVYGKRTNKQAERNELNIKKPLVDHSNHVH